MDKSIKSSCNKSETIFTGLRTAMMEDGFKKTHRATDSSFVRERVLGMVGLIGLQINRLALSLGVELEKFLSLLGIGASYSKQAFSQARKKLKHTAFTDLNSRFVEGYYSGGDIKLYDGRFLLLAVDGSLCQLPESKAVSGHFGRWKNQLGGGLSMGRASVLYDVLNRVVLSGILSPCTDGERGQFYLMRDALMARAAIKGFVPLYLMDRGYPSFGPCKDLDVAGDKFVIRCKKTFCKEVSQFAGGDKTEGTLYFSPRAWVRGVGKVESGHSEGLHLRIVRIRLPPGEDEYLLTNTDFTIGQLGGLYFLRWGVETLYGQLKGPFQLEGFSSKTVEGVLQDFHSSLLVANMSNLLIAEAQEELESLGRARKEKTGNKYDQQINRNMALGMLRDHLYILLMDPNKDMGKELGMLKEKIKRHTTAVKPGRNFKRHKLKRTKRKFHPNKKRPF